MTISELCYELYKINWMKDHVSVQEQMDSLKNYYEDSKMDTVPTTYQQILEEFGYRGEMYVCFKEFLENEYQVKEFIKKLLGNNNLFKDYEADLADMKKNSDN